MFLSTAQETANCLRKTDSFQSGEPTLRTNRVCGISFHSKCRDRRYYWPVHSSFELLDGTCLPDHSISDYGSPEVYLLKLGSMGREWQKCWWEDKGKWQRHDKIPFKLFFVCCWFIWMNPYVLPPYSITMDYKWRKWILPTEKTYSHQESYTDKKIFINELMHTHGLT